MAANEPFTDKQKPDFGDEHHRLLQDAQAKITALEKELSRLKKVEKRQRERADTFKELSRILNYSLDQTQLLELILDQLGRVLEYDSACIMMLEGGKFSITAHRRFESPEEQLSIPREIQIFPHIQTVLKTRRPLIIPDTHQDSGWYKFKAGEYIRSWLGVPLIGREKVLGLLNLDKKEPGFYTEEDAELALVFANQAAIAIENARLYASVQQQLSQFDALRATVADISKELELPKLLKAILERAVTLIGAVGGDLGLFDEKSQVIEIVACHHMDKDYTGTRMKMGEGAMGQAVETLQSVIVEDYTTWESASPVFLDGGWHAVLAVPILMGGHVVGAVAVVQDHPDKRFTTSDEHLLTLFAQHAAIAVENARLFQQVREAVEKWKIMHKISQEIVAANLNPEEIYQRIHWAASQLMHAEAFAITLLNEPRNLIEAVYLFDSSGRVPATTIPLGRGLSGRVIASGQSIYIPDTEDKENLGEVVHLGDPHEVRSVLAVPLRLRGEVIGMLSAQSYQPWAYTSEDQYWLEMLAAYAAIALDNSRLLLNVQRLAVTDDLTQLYNHRRLFELGNLEFYRARRFDHALSVIMIDIDHFKSVNDAYGHLVGDYVLRKLSQLLKAHVREIDIVGRYGGEEFTIILPETEVAYAREVAERLRRYIEETFQLNALPTHESHPVPVTVSMGVAGITPEIQDFVGLVNHSDIAMYAAKSRGGNCVEIYSG